MIKINTYDKFNDHILAEGMVVKAIDKWDAWVVVKDNVTGKWSMFAGTKLDSPEMILEQGTEVTSNYVARLWLNCDDEVMEQFKHYKK